MPEPRTDRREWIEQEQERILRSEVDESLIQDNLLSTPAERLARHDRSLAATAALRHAPRSVDDGQPPPPTSGRR